MTNPSSNNMGRRAFLDKLMGLVVGCASASLWIFAAAKGRRIQPFLGGGSDAVLNRFGKGRKLLEHLDISSKHRRKLAKRVLKLKRKADERATPFERSDFTRVLGKSIQKDYSRDRVLLVDNWLLSETEVGVFLYNHLHQNGKIR